MKQLQIQFRKINKNYLKGKTMEFENKKLRSVAEAAARIMMGEKALHPNQQKLDVHEPEKDELTSHDFKKLRTMKKEETMHEESCECGSCPSDKDMKKEGVDLDEGKMGQLDADLKDLSHDDFHKEYGKPKSHYDPSNFKKPVQKGKEMDRAKALAQRGMASMKKEEVGHEEDLEEGILDGIKNSFYDALIKKAKEKIPAKHHKDYDFESMRSMDGTNKLTAKAKAAGHELRIGKFPFSASGKASASGAKEGFVKLVFDKKYGELLGAHLIGANVTEMIAEIVAIRKLETTGHELIKTVHPHPTMSEAIMEAAAAAYDEVIHL